MPASHLARRSSNKAAALIIVLAFVVLLTGLALAYFSRTTSERQLAHSSYNDTLADLAARTALDIIVSDFKQEIVNGSTATTVNGSTVYTPLLPAYMVPLRSGSSSLAPNLIRRSVANDPIQPPGRPSRASAVSSIPDPANPKRGDVTKARWNEHYLVPKLNTGDDGTEPIAAFTPPDWVFVTDQGPTAFPFTSQCRRSLRLCRLRRKRLVGHECRWLPDKHDGNPVRSQRVSRLRGSHRTRKLSDSQWIGWRLSGGQTCRLAQLRDHETK